MSTLVAQTISNGTVSTSTANVINGAKAWVNYKGTATRSIRASYNVSSVTFNGTGDYTINFTNAFADANYAAMAGANLNNSNSDTRRTCRVITWATSSVTVITGDTSGGASTKEDFEFVTVAVFR